MSRITAIFSTLVVSLGVCWCGTGALLAQSTGPTGDSSTVSGIPGVTQNDCLSQPISLAWMPPGAGEKAKSAGKGILSSVLSTATGGSVRSGEKGTELARRPRLPESNVDLDDRDMRLELQGGIIDGALIMAVRVRKDREKGGPHLIALQDINCRVLLPEQVEVFELWESGGLSVSWSSSTYSGGELVGSESGAFDANWDDFRARYPNTADIPGIWANYDQPPLDGIRGATATFSLPPGETFDPSAWYLITHITVPADSPNTVATQPVVSEIEPGSKDRYTFSQAQKVKWRPPAVAASVGSALQVGATQGLVCEDDCRKIIDEINALECAREDCEDEQAALEAAEQAHQAALQALADAEADQAEAISNISNAQRAHDDARADFDRAQRKLNIESQKQRRLQESLGRGGLGLGPQQTEHAIDFSRGVVDRLESRVADARAALDAAQAAIDAGNAALDAANAAIAAARAEVETTQEAMDQARQALSDCLHRDWQRCRAIEELWAEHRECRARCRAQDKTRRAIDDARGFVEGGAAEMAEDNADYDSLEADMGAANDGTRELGGAVSQRAKDDAEQARQARNRARQLAEDAGEKLSEAENDYNRGDLDGAREAAREAEEIQRQAEEAMDDAADAMQDAAEEARRAYQGELREKYLREQAEYAAERRAAALKKQACMRQVAEYFAAQEGNTALLEDLGGFVAGDARDALDQARDSEYTPEQVQEFLDKVEAQRHRLEQILTLINGIGDNASIESRNEAFGTALDIAGEISERIPGLGEFFNFYSGAFNAAVQALYGLQQRLIDQYKPMVDDSMRGALCCAYGYEELNEKTMQQIIDERWADFARDNRLPLSRVSPDTLRKIEAYFRSRLTVEWARCCIDFTLDG